MNIEQQRLQNPDWKKWGPYLSDRQWGTVREDYSPDGEAWEYTTHDMARSKAWRWGEDGIAGICDDKQLLCFAISLWNKRDPIIKERFFGLSGHEGNHGEDVKELYYFLDCTPTHSYMKMLYKYPLDAFPYSRLVEENKKRTRQDPEFEIIDTGIFNDSKYFDVFAEYAKAEVNDIYVKITVHNRWHEDAALHVLPTIWFRNTWAWGYDDYKPILVSSNNEQILVNHHELGDMALYVNRPAEILFCDNETNVGRLYGSHTSKGFFKDGINDYLVGHHQQAINTNASGTKAAVNVELTVKAGKSEVILLRLSPACKGKPFEKAEQVFHDRLEEANAFYGELQEELTNEDAKMVQRQAYAGMLWSKQLYYYNIRQWLHGDPAQPPPPAERLDGRNHTWMHLNNFDVISMPDKWEYPWYASWDLAFHCIPLSMIDPAFAKRQLRLLTKEWYMHPNGQLPAYEWAFSDVNPPVHAWAAFRVFKIDEKITGKADIAFLETIFHKLLLNFTWWVNRKDAEGNNIFEGGFLGLDNIGVFDRSAPLPTGGYIEQADGTSWVAMYSLNLLRISLELAMHNPVYQDMATKFFEHFLYIAEAMFGSEDKNLNLWDDEDQFFYDLLKMPDKTSQRLKVRSMVGLSPLFAVEVLEHELLDALPKFAGHLQWFLENRPDLASLVSRWQEKNVVQKHLLSLLRGHRMKKILERMLDENEFFGEYGIRALSKYHEEHPYELKMDGHVFSVKYSPGESTTELFGGNSNWRGPIWMPANFLIIESLQRFHYYYGDDFKVECPTHSAQYLTLNEIADEIARRLSNLFLRNESGKRPVFGENNMLQFDPHFNNYILFHEYFHGDNGRGLGASHQTGWTGLVARLLQPRANPWPEMKKEAEEEVGTA